MTLLYAPILYCSRLAALCFLAVGCTTTPPAETAPPAEPPPAIVGSNEATAGAPKTGVTISAADAASTQSLDRDLTLNQVSKRVRAMYKLDEVGVQAFGGRNHPFTTKRASSQAGITAVNEFPSRATGKLRMKFGSNTFVCTASVIEKSLLVTAAHCVHNFGQKGPGFADAVTFEPARHESTRPFGTWTAKQWWVPTPYWNGTDVCSSQAPGIVCENDVAVIVVQEKNGRAIADVTGQYGYPKNDDDFGYTTFLGETAAQITQMGYPSKNFDGDKMIRTDSLGYWDDPMNVIIGSNQTGGSSGGPWLQNFGMRTSFTGTSPFDNESNQVVATTSWGFTLDTLKVQGASRFSKNSSYTIKSNIESLVDSACAANTGAC